MKQQVNKEGRRIVRLFRSPTLDTVRMVEKTIEKFNSRDNFPEDENLTNQKNSQLLIQILNQNNPLISSTVNSQIDIEINVNLELIQKTCDEIEGEASFLIEEIKKVSSISTALAQDIYASLHPDR